MSIWHTQEVHDAATRVLALHPGADAATCALVEVTILEVTTAALLAKHAGAWEIVRLYTVEAQLPGEVGVAVIGVWVTCGRNAVV